MRAKHVPLVAVAVLTGLTTVSQGRSITEIIDTTGDGVNHLDDPRDVAVDSSGAVYVAGYYSNNLFKITDPGLPTQTVQQVIAYPTDNLQGPVGIAVDSVDNVYVAGYWSDNVFKIENPGTPSQVVTEIINPSLATIDGTHSVAVDGAGNVFVTSSRGVGLPNDGAVFMIEPNGTITQLMDKTGGGVAPLHEPWGIAVDTSGTVYVACYTSNNGFQIKYPGTSNQEIREIIDGTPVTPTGQYVLTAACGVAVDPATGAVVVTGSHSANAFEVSNPGEPGQIIRRLISADDGLDEARRIAVDPSCGNIYVAGEHSNDAFRILASPVDLVTEIIDATGDGMGGILSQAWGVAVGAPNVVFVSGAHSDNVFMIDTSEYMTPYCFGDLGSGIPCPCGNDNDGSVPGSGCANGVFASGAQLTASGIASVTADTLVLHCSHLEPDNAGLYFQAENQVGGGVGSWWNDGLRCAGGNLKRLGVRFADSTGYSDTSGFAYSISQRSALLGHTILPGELLNYQCWYRTTDNPPCGLGVYDSNTTNGLSVFWLP